MKKFLFLILVITSCNELNTKKDNLKITEEKSTSKKELEKFYDSDKIEHFYLDISEEKVIFLLRKENKNTDLNNLVELLTSNYPTTISEPNFEDELLKNKFIKTELSEIKKKEIDNIFRQKDSAQVDFSSCLPYYRDIFILKKNDSIIGIAKVCFGCGVSQFKGTKINTEGFGLKSELKKLEKIIRNK